MTKRERAQVVELLRCAADDDGTSKDCPVGIVAACIFIDPPYGIRWGKHGAWAAYDAVKTETPGLYRAELLEAALRVEQGEWP